MKEEISLSLANDYAQENLKKLGNCNDPLSLGDLHLVVELLYSLLINDNLKTLKKSHSNLSFLLLNSETKITSSK